MEASGAVCKSNSPAPNARGNFVLENARMMGRAALAVALVLVSIPSCSAAGKARFPLRFSVDRGLAFARGWNSTPRAADLPLQKGKCGHAGSQRKPSLANVHCQIENKPRNTPAMLAQVKSNMVGVCKAIPTVKGAIAAAAVATVWYMYPTLATAADVSASAAGKIAAAASSPALQFASFLPPGLPPAIPKQSHPVPLQWSPLPPAPTDARHPVPIQDSWRPSLSSSSGASPSVLPSPLLHRTHSRRGRARCREGAAGPPSLRARVGARALRHARVPRAARGRQSASRAVQRAGGGAAGSGRAAARGVLMAAALGRAEGEEEEHLSAWDPAEARSETRGRHSRGEIERA
jgi:hypothetical protein